VEVREVLGQVTEANRLQLWVEDPKLVQAFLKQTFQPGEADKHSVSGT